MGNEIWTEVRGEGPLVAVAVHAGHGIREELREHLLLSEADRFREEDPFTDQWTSVAPTRLVALRSRFEVDLNRPRETAVYRTPDQSWGMRVWKGDLPGELVEGSLREHDAFYVALGRILEEVRERHGRFVLLDIHSYCHRRGGPGTPPEDPGANPEVNLGTGTLDRDRWGRLADRFVADLRSHPVPWGSLDVRENVRFKGAHLSRWVHETFPGSGCALALEFKKTFMDEWTGVPDREHIAALGEALRSTIPGLQEELRGA